LKKEILAVQYKLNDHTINNAVTSKSDIKQIQP